MAGPKIEKLGRQIIIQHPKDGIPYLITAKKRAGGGGDIHHVFEPVMEPALRKAISGGHAESEMRIPVGTGPKVTTYTIVRDPALANEVLTIAQKLNLIQRINKK